MASDCFDTIGSVRQFALGVAANHKQLHGEGMYSNISSYFKIDSFIDLPERSNNTTYEKYFKFQDLDFLFVTYICCYKVP